MRKAALMLSIILFSGCATLNKADVTRYTDTTYPPKSESYQMDIKDRQNIDQEFTVIGEVRGKLSTVYQSEQDVIGGMKDAARKIGGDALVDLETRTVDESHDWIADNNTYYKAKVIVYE